MDGDVIEAIHTVIARLRPAEAAVATVVLRDPDSVVDTTVVELAERAGVSQASVVRFAKTLGYTGFPALRLQLAQELSRHAADLERSDIAEGRLNPSDSLADMVSKVAFHEARTIEQTARLLDLEALEQTAQRISAGARVVAFGVGASALAASDLAQKLQRIGLNCLTSPDIHMQLVHAALADEHTVVVAFSFSGGTRDVVHAVEVATRTGALTVAVTGDGESALAGACDLFLRTPARETTLRAAALASRMAQLAVVDFLFLRVGQLRFDNLDAALDATRDAVRPQHLPDGTQRSPR
ncbi:MurR/RpiR family transcriptional regulator [Microbacterium lacticum]|uniref:RpiR family transcriptional regulator n=1 Tax=Microbacterium lacticum TaxID=33885 RepID=A0A4Y3UQQ3_9MICO|nr:MurR/RpiR family transcriptional regulator [Microbacterium lacticum]TQM97968.1 RpiR family transcriptional regulator [Microbacterium lacticum]GEB95808.1 RpiR family transcriptional regulator [Microbacterium lacticum]GGI69105.1 RpiR family transcriptional regulator [Microbacterium lacticum]